MSNLVPLRSHYQWCYGNGNSKQIRIELSVNKLRARVLANKLTLYAKNPLNLCILDQDNGYPKSLLIAMKLPQILSGCQHQTLLGYFRSKDGKTIRNINDTDNER